MNRRRQRLGNGESFGYLGFKFRKAVGRNGKSFLEKTGGRKMYRVLIVANDGQVGRRLRQFPEWNVNGFAIESCSSKKALMKIFSQQFDLMITDMKIPSINGSKLVSNLRIQNSNLCLVLLSRCAKHGIRLAVFDYIVKPIENNDLMNALRQIKNYLDEKNKISEFDDTLNLYYLKSRERKLIDLILAGSDSVIAEASSICLEFIWLANKDLSKLGILLEIMLKNLNEQIYKTFPFLEWMQKMVFPNTFNNIKSVERMKRDFLFYINSMSEIIRKYELHHTDDVIRKTCLYVIENVEADITLNNIANELYISSSYVGKMFKHKTGSNFRNYVTKVKMEYAKYLLKTCKYKNYEISEKLAYNNLDYFCRLFKSYTGYTPREFKMSIKTQINTRESC